MQKPFYLQSNNLLIKIMGRIKGQKMTEEQKAAMRAKRAAKKQSKSEAFSMVTSSIKHLSYNELEQVIDIACRVKKDKLGEEELKLIKQKEEIEQKLQELQSIDKEVNE